MQELVVCAFNQPSSFVTALRGGFFSDGGLEVRVVKATGSEPQFRGLMSGEWDILHTNSDNVMKYRQSGESDAVVVHVVERNMPMNVVVGPGIQDWEALQGERVGVDAVDSGFAFVLYELLDAHGVADGTYDVVSLGNDEARFEALRASEISACLLSFRPFQEAVGQGFLVLARGRDHFPDYPGLTVAARRSWVDQNSAAVDRYTDALGRAAEWSRDDANRQRVVQFLAETHDCSAGDASDLLDLERSSRTGDVRTPADARASLEVVAGLRERYTGHRPVGYLREDPAR